MCITIRPYYCVLCLLVCVYRPWHATLAKAHLTHESNQCAAVFVYTLLWLPVSHHPQVNHLLTTQTISVCGCGSASVIPYLYLHYAVTLEGSVANCTTKTTVYICFPLTLNSSTNICKTYESRNRNQQSHGNNLGCQCGMHSGVTPLTTDGKPTFFFLSFFFL